MPIKNVKLGKNVKIPFPELVNLYGCRIGDNCMIGPFVEIQKGVKIGNNTRVQSHSFICSKVIIGKEVFIGHGVMFINDRYPVHKNSKDWQKTVVGDKAVIGSNATILPCRIGNGALIGAGATVTCLVEKNRIVAGNPAKVIGIRKKR
jgi:acetyltransferase-like isoleucine patch superfamily enzyme